MRAIGELVHIAADSATFKEVIPGVWKAALWGDAEKGPYGAFTRQKPGQRSGLHTHSSDIQIVVLEGAYYHKVGGEELRVGPKEFLFIPGGSPHESRADDKDGVLFYEESEGRFDANFLEK